jgi:hypothetical protein
MTKASTYNYQNKFRTLREIEKLCGIEYKTLKARIHKGWNIEDAAFTPLGQKTGPKLTLNAEWQRRVENT